VTPIELDTRLRLRRWRDADREPLAAMYRIDQPQLDAAMQNRSLRT